MGFVHEADESEDNNILEVKRIKRKKSVKENFDSGFVNTGLDLNDGADETTENNVLEVKRNKVKKKKVKDVDNGFINIGLELNDEAVERIENNVLEVKRKKLKKKKVTEDCESGFVNTGLDLSNQNCETTKNDAFEVKRKEIEGNGLENPGFQSSPSQNLEIPDCDLMLNVTSTPLVQKKPIENNKNCHINRAFNANYSPNQKQRLLFAKNTIENCEAEVENEINEKRYPTVGEIGDSDGENEKLEEGTKLRYKYASFSERTPWYHCKAEGSRKSYKHLIKGDIVLCFKNTNLHEIHGYAVRRNAQR